MGENTFQSGANQVRLVRTGTDIYVEKHYQEQLKNYPEQWPISRVSVEAFTLKLLSTRTCDSSVWVPALLWQGPDTIRMEYCPGTALAELEPERLCVPSLWRELFSFLYGLRSLGPDAFPEDVQRALGRQNAILECMLRWKTDQQILPSPLPAHFCLGDVSLNNILLDGAHVYLLDFECAHWGYAGYDVGQLLAMAETWWGGLPLFHTVEAAAWSAIPDPVYRGQCRYWKEKLLGYYKRACHPLKK